MDVQSMVNVFSNGTVEQYTLCRMVLSLYCNAGQAIVTKKGDLKSYITVSYHLEVANILSLHDVQNKYKMTHESSMMFVVRKSDGNEHMFKPYKKGLFFSDVKQDLPAY